MIVVKLMGGLGNQMFQYAAGRCLSHLHKTELKLDLSFLNADPKNEYTKRKLELDFFNVKIEEASKEEINEFKIGTSGAIRNTLQQKLPILFSTIVANENKRGFMKEFYSYPKNLYLNGFWQSEKYFEPVKEILLKEFTLKENLSSENQKLAQEIQNCNSVSLHIRRGDYVSNKVTNEFHGLCSLEYYMNAISKIKEKHGEIKVFVFSDDINWAKENIKETNTVFISRNPSHIDMHLMSLCKHNIIANSSFSWWGTWLNKNAGKIVIAPKNWFAKQELNSPDIYPDNWIKL